MAANKHLAVTAAAHRQGAQEITWVAAHFNVCVLVGKLLIIWCWHDTGYGLPQQPAALFLMFQRHQCRWSMRSTSCWKRSACSAASGKMSRKAAGCWQQHCKGRNWGLVVQTEWDDQKQDTNAGRTAACKIRHPEDLWQQNNSSPLIWGGAEKWKSVEKITWSLDNKLGGQISSTGRHNWTHWSTSAGQNQQGEAVHAGGGDSSCRGLRHSTANLTPSLGSLLLA